MDFTNLARSLRWGKNFEFILPLARETMRFECAGRRGGMEQKPLRLVRVGFTVRHGRMRDSERVPAAVRSFEDGMVVHLPLGITLSRLEPGRVWARENIGSWLLDMDPTAHDFWNQGCDILGGVWLLRRDGTRGQ